MSPTEWIIDVKNLRKTFPRIVAIDNISLQVKKGEIFGFLGPNGGGKTTFIRMLCGLLIPDSGSGQVLGYDIIKESYAIKRKASYMPQHFSLYTELSVYENLDFIARLYAIQNPQREVEKIIQEFNFENPKQTAGTLSGGWQQRLALAAALLHKPTLLLLDEPTIGVDPQARREFWAHLHNLANRGVTTLVSTHYMDEAERCNRLAYILEGRILIEGSAAEIIAQSKLITWEVTGSELEILREQLQKNYPRLLINRFDQALHVCSDRADYLEKALAEFQSEKWLWKKIDSNLEDTFIYLVKQ